MSTPWKRSHRRTQSLPFSEDLLNECLKESKEVDDGISLYSEAGSIGLQREDHGDEIIDLCHSPTNPHRSIWNLFDSTDCSDAGVHTTVAQESSPIINGGDTNLPVSLSSSSNSLAEDRRMLVLKEIVSTERKYISCLEIILTDFLPQLEHTVLARDLRLMFPCQLEPLISYHQQFLNNLLERVEGNCWHGIVGDLFGRMCNHKDKEMIALYNAYMHEFKVAMKTVTQYERNSSKFRQELNYCQRKCGGLSLTAFLLTPVQRLPRYELLLKEVLKHTPKTHPDNYFIEVVLKELKASLVTLDRSIQSCQLACSFTRVKDKNRKKRTMRKKFKLSRHTSTVDDSFNSSPEHSPRSLRDSMFSSKFHSGSLQMSGRACSQTNLLEPDSPSDSGSMVSRAISCSDVSFMGTSEDREPSLMDDLSSLAPNTIHFLPEEEEDEYHPMSNNTATLRPMHSSSSGVESNGSDEARNTTLVRKDTKTNVTQTSSTPKSNSLKRSQTPSLYNAFRKLRSNSDEKNMSNKKEKDISKPLDFRHIEHSQAVNHWTSVL